MQSRGKEKPFDFILRDTRHLHYLQFHLNLFKSPFQGEAINKIK